MKHKKVIGFIPARMNSSRFYGKPLAQILGLPMLGHVIKRAQLYKNWDGLYLTTCDKEIKEYGESLNIPVIMTSGMHSRALDRIAEAVIKCDETILDDDIIVNVQGDEPLLTPEMIKATISPMIELEEVDGTILSIDIIHEKQYYDENVLKIIHNLKGDILYTSRSPIPYCKKFNKSIGAKRIFGLFGFKWHFLKTFNKLDESPLEIVESCDSNRLYDNGYFQRLVPFPYIDSYAVDVPDDIKRVEKIMKKEKFWMIYNQE